MYQNFQCSDNFTLIGLFHLLFDLLELILHLLNIYIFKIFTTLVISNFHFLFRVSIESLI